MKLFYVNTGNNNDLKDHIIVLAKNEEDAIKIAKEGYPGFNYIEAKEANITYPGIIGLSI